MNKNHLIAKKLSRNILYETIKYIKPGRTTLEIENRAKELMNYHNVKSAFYGYRGYPNHICVSINEEILHGIPSHRIVKNGDLVTVDLGVIYKGWYGDNARTIIVGKDIHKQLNFVATTRLALKMAIIEAVEGNLIDDISTAIQRCVESNGYSVVRRYCGHGIGRELHKPPYIPCHSIGEQTMVIKSGDVYAIEVMAVNGIPFMEVDKNNWTVKCFSKYMTAHFEEMVFIK